MLMLMLICIRAGLACRVLLVLFVPGVLLSGNHLRAALDGGRPSPTALYQDSLSKLSPMRLHES
jgi:hypothetical protein